MPKESLKDKLDGNELDLSMSSLSTVPVADIAILPKATHLDLSCNRITHLPENFSSTLNYIIKLDLSKNQLTVLPEDIGKLQKLQHLDLLGNKLATLPVGMGYLKSLKWLDLKDNALDDTLTAVAGDCLNETQCRQCATRIVAFMKSVQSEQERKLQKKLNEEREKAAVRKLEEQNERERRKAEKQADKDRRRREYEAAQQENREIETREEGDLTNQDAIRRNVGKVMSGSVSPATSGGFSSYCVIAVLFAAFAVVVGVCFYCDSNKTYDICEKGLETFGDFYERIADYVRGFLK